MLRFLLKFLKIKCHVMDGNQEEASLVELFELYPVLLNILNEGLSGRPKFSIFEFIILDIRKFSVYILFPKTTVRCSGQSLVK